MFRKLRSHVVVRSTAAVATLIVSAAVAACGEDEAGSDKADFVEQADQICADYTSERTELWERHIRYPLSSVAPYHAGRLTANEHAVSALRELSPPEGEEQNFDRYVKLREGLNPLIDRSRAAGEKEDLDALDALALQEAKKGVELERLAGAMGMRDCAGRGLSGPDRDMIEKTIEQVATIDDPAVCSTAMTPGHVRYNFKTSAACRAAQRKPENTAESVRVENLAGTRNSATATMIPSGGGVTVKRVDVRVVKIDGTWKFQYAPQREPGDPAPSPTTRG